MFGTFLRLLLVTGHTPRQISAYHQIAMGGFARRSVGPASENFGKVVNIMINLGDLLSLVIF